MARRAAAMILSAVATLEPPNFCTIKGTVASPKLNRCLRNDTGRMGPSHRREEVSRQAGVADMRDNAVYGGRMGSIPLFREAFRVSLLRTATNRFAGASP